MTSTRQPSRRPGPIVCILCFAVLVSPCRSGASASDAPADQLNAYSPIESDFRPEYDRDHKNGKLQTWEQYWGWVRTFYRGNLLARGWTHETSATLSTVTTPDARRVLARELNEMGRDVAREWAKETAARRIHLADVRQWGNRLKLARQADDGSGKLLMTTVKLVRAEVAKKLEGTPATAAKSPGR